MNAVIARKSLTIFDKCDRCGAQARVRASFISGDLYFCGHHAQKFEVSKNSLGIELYDSSEKYRFE